jgi:hypothetical protein
MKRNILIGLAVCIAVVLLCSCFYFSGDKNKLNSNDLVRYYYKIHNGYSGISREYEIEYKDSIVTATMRDCNFLIDSCDVYSTNDVPRETLVEIGEMLIKAKVQNWESSYTNRDVFDGDSWSMDVKFGKDLIWSSGYMAWPDNDPTHEINKIIYNLCKPQKEEPKQ